MGGFMEPDKSAWYLVDYEWRRSKWKYTNPGQDKILEATNKAGEHFPLQYLQANEGMSILGMNLALDGNNKHHVKYMHKKATAWETSIRAGGIQQNKA